jgi:hypothetical protein
MAYSSLDRPSGEHPPTTAPNGNGDLPVRSPGMRGLDGEGAKTAGVEIAVDVIQGVRALPVAGAHINAPRVGDRGRPAGGQGGRARRDGRRLTLGYAASE